MYVVINSDCGFIPEGVKPLVSEGSALLNLLRCLDYDPVNPPLADLLRRTHHLDGEWLVLSPIHWQATHNDALIMATGKDLAIEEQDARLWFKYIAEYLAEEDMTLHFHDTETWLLCDRKQHPLNAKPVHQLLNRSLMPELKQLDETMFWQKFITESQMLFASKSNQSAMNGLWPWGNAKLADKTETTICADAYFLPFAQQCSAQVVLYDPTIKLKEQSVLLISELSLLSEAHQQELKKLPVHWYWNNTAYTRTNNNWFTRLWRTVTHAH